MSKLHSIELDVQLTRMKRFHIVRDAEGETVWRSARISEAIEWLYDRDVTRFHLIIDGTPWLCNIKPPATPRSPD